eukprot:4251213-Amphidinium_carterae.1
MVLVVANKTSESRDAAFERFTLESLDNDPPRLRLGVDSATAASVIPRNMSKTQVVKDELAGTQRRNRSYLGR